LAGALVLAGSLVATGAGTTAAAAPDRLAYEPFTAARLAALEAAGKPVFVNLTADWCVTCLINERVALDSAGVR
jgi:thiol:disulfide interchange protein